eukprot:scaffold54658_cov55-Phaeocystis_antarctica.AAC.1
MKPPCAAGCASKAAAHASRLPDEFPIACAYSERISGLTCKGVSETGVSGQTRTGCSRVARRGGQAARAECGRM